MEDRLSIIAPSIDKLPYEIQRSLESGYQARIPFEASYEHMLEAQAWLDQQATAFENERLDVAFDDSEIRARADRWSTLCSKMAIVSAMQSFASSKGIKPPIVGKPSSSTELSVARRLQSARWWRRALRRSWTRQAETHLRAVGMVHRRHHVYASDLCVAFRRERKMRDRSMLQELLATSDAGDQLELFAIVEKSTANPAIRRAELMTRIAGFEGIAKEEGHDADFWTLTCPSAYHATLADGRPNPHWKGFTPREGQEWLRRLWANARAKLHKKKVLYYGVRIAEPHHDGTPHWHMVLFGERSALDLVQKVIGKLWLSEYGHEPGAQEVRTRVKRINQSLGSATGYISKYVAKNIDGFKVGDDHETAAAVDGQREFLQADETAARVAAWASAHGIRQFQQLGGPQVTLWREMRRLRKVVSDPALEKARQAVEEPSWKNFVNAIGGIKAGRNTNILLWKAPQERIRSESSLPVDQATGEVIDLASLRLSLRRRNCYDEIAPDQIIGVESALSRIRTREKIWRISKKERSEFRASPPLGPVSITVTPAKIVPTRRRREMIDYRELMYPPWARRSTA